MSSRLFLLAGACVAAFGLGAQAQAAETTDDAAASARADVIEEVVVTARRREEKLQETPISISAFNAADLEERQVRTSEDLGRFAPNLITTHGQGISGNSSAGSYFIRGIGQVDFLLNTDPGVGVYVDGVYVARALGSFMDLVDLERVEVLRGPQGTLFGRNTIGGAVSITTRKPDGTFAGEADATLGSFDRHDLRATVNLPINDKVMAAGAILWREQDGYVRRITNNTRLGDLESVSAHAAVRVLPVDAVTIDLSYDLVRDHGTSPPANLVAVNEASPFVGLFNALQGPACLPPPGPLTNPQCFNSQWVAKDLRIDQGTFTSRQKTDVDAVSLTGEWRLSDTLTLKSISGWRKTRALGNRDGDHTPLNFQHTTDIWNHTQKSEELQLLGRTPNDALNWIAGVYAFKETGTNVNIVDLVPVKGVSGGSVDNRNYAAFGQFTYAITSALKLTAGARWTRDEKSFVPDQFLEVDRAGLFPPGLVPGLRLLPKERVATSTEKFTPHIDIAYQVNPDALVYATFSEGFKSGGFTQRIFPPLPEVPSFGPEKVKSYEVGAKLEGLDHHVRVNGAAFYTDYADLQVQVLDGVQPLIRNAAAAHIKGFEVEALALPVAGLRLEAGLGYTDAEYSRLNAGSAQVGLTLDKRFPQVPKWNGSLAASYRAELPNGLTLTPHVDYTFQSATFMDAANTLRQPSYGLLGASLRLDAENWSIEAFGRNLSDKSYITGGFADPATEGTSEASIGRPREYGVTLRYRY